MANTNTNMLLLLLSLTAALSSADIINRTISSDVFELNDRIVVTDQAMGARCAVAADFDGDGRMDIVSASSNDNAVSWFHNEGRGPGGDPTFSIKRQITWSSLGSRIVTVADIDGDGDVDVVGASYYDSSLRWYENDGTGQFTSHDISSAVNEGQGVTVADLDNDGDPDIATASSGDNTIAVFKNIDHGVFCEIKEVVDDNAVGARTVVASDLNGDGWIDLASASKDDDTIAWYPNDGSGHFPTKIVISSGFESIGAYSLVAVDIEKDGDNDLIVASNGNDHVSLWRNDGAGNFNKTLIYDRADFVLSVTAVDFDRDGDIDVASASFFDGYIRWYENLDGRGNQWRNHRVYVGVQGHYVSHADMDGDGDEDLIAVTHAENTVAVFLAKTECDFIAASGAAKTKECCHLGSEWNGTACEPCKMGTYGVGSGTDARCVACPSNSCTIPGRNVVPATCAGITGCADAEGSVMRCSCPANNVKDPNTDSCAECPAGNVRLDNGLERGVNTIGNYTAWEEQQGVCIVPAPQENLNQISALVPIGLSLMSIALALSLFFAGWTFYHRQVRIVRASQPFFLVMICFGTAVMSTAIVVFGIDDKKYSVEACNIACMSAPWLICTGFTIAFSAVFSKIWRINKVMQNALRKIKVTERDVLKPFVVLFTLNVLVLLIWTIIDPLRWSREPVKDGQYWETYGTCSSNGVASIVCVVLLALIALAALILACIQAYMARTISDEYSESKFIGIAIICWLQLLIVGLPLLLLVKTNPTASYFLKTTLTFLVSTSLLLLVFVPKMIQKKKKPKPRENVRISISSTASDTLSPGPASEITDNLKAHRSRRMSMGANGMRIVSPQLEIVDLKAEIQGLLSQIQSLKTRNRQLEEMYQAESSEGKAPLHKNDSSEGTTSSKGLTSAIAPLFRRSSCSSTGSYSSVGDTKQRGILRNTCTMKDGGPDGFGMLNDDKDTIASDVEIGEQRRANRRVSFEDIDITDLDKEARKETGRSSTRSRICST